MKQYMYPICDCEHDGDIRCAEHEVEAAGGKVVRSYWDGHDCGEAYVVFTLKDGVTFDEVESKLGDVYSY